MNHITGIELGPNSCVLVRAAEHASHATVTAARALTPGEWTDDHDELVDLLRSARRRNKLPPRARVVAWGLRDSSASTDLSHLPELGPLVAAGFEIDGMMSPVQALAELVRARQRESGDRAVAALSINHHGVAIAIVADGTVVASRVFEWPLGRPFAAGRSELFERYLIVSQLAPELRHLIDLVRPVHGVTVTSAVACGNLPNLRSLTMLLIEEMDLEVETLDSAELLDAGGAARFVDLVPALQLAAHAAAVAPAAQNVGGNDEGSGSGADRGNLSPHMSRRSRNTLTELTTPRAGSRRDRGRVLRPLTSVAALVLCATWSVLAVSGSSPATPVFRDGLGEIAAGIPAVPDLPAEATIGRIGTRDPGLGPPSLATPLNGPATAEARESESSMRRHAPAEPPSALATPIATTPGPPTANREPRAAIPAPQVDGIMIAGDRRLAIVNGAIVTVGDSVGGHVVVKIERDRVLLQSPSGREVYVAIRTRKPAPRGS
jgi:hypothetical protein